MKNYLWIILSTLIIFGCSNNNDLSDAYGNFEADEIVVSAELNGKIIDFPFEEGDKIDKDAFICQIDTVQVYLQKQEILTKMNALEVQEKIIFSQIKQAKLELTKIQRDVNRFEELVKNNAATQKQFDDLLTNKNIMNEKLMQANLSKEKVQQEKEALRINLLKINDQLSKSKVTSPIAGTILKKYYNNGEFITIGRPILSVADIDELILKAYISGDQLSKIKLGQEVQVLIDEENKEMKTYVGKISYISDKSEFTPKIIQTKTERISQVYAIKILVKNDGLLKIGMPAEVVF